MEQNKTEPLAQDQKTSSGSAPADLSQKVVLTSDQEEVVAFLKEIKAAAAAKDFKSMVAILRNGVAESKKEDFDKKVASMTQGDIDGLWDGMNYLYGGIDPAILETDATEWKMNGDAVDVIITTHASASANSKSTWTVHFKKVEGNWTTA